MYMRIDKSMYTKERLEGTWLLCDIFVIFVKTIYSVKKKEKVKNQLSFLDTLVIRYL